LASLQYFKITILQQNSLEADDGVTLVQMWSICKVPRGAASSDRKRRVRSSVDAMTPPLRFFVTKGLQFSR